MSLVWFERVLLVTSFMSIVTIAYMKSSDDASFRIVNLLWWLNNYVIAVQSFLNQTVIT